jgi:hypothetical protein
MSRLPLPDLLKGIAVFLIIPVHILEFFIDQAGRESLFGKTLLFLGGPICVPVFMIMMGYFIAGNEKPLKKNLLRGIKVLFLGLILNIALNFHLLIRIFFGGWNFNPWEYIFGVDILYLAGLAIIFLSVIKTVGKGKEWVALILFLIVAGFSGIINEKIMLTEKNYILPFIGGYYSWSYFPIFPWMAYSLAGFAFYYHEEKIRSFLESRRTIPLIILSCLMLLVLLFSKWGFEITVNLPAYYHHTFLYSLWATGIVVLWSLLIRFLLKKFHGNITTRFLMWLGKNITLFYIIQWLIIGNVATSIYQTQDISTYLYWFAGIFPVSILLTFLIGKTGIRLAK